MLNIAKEALESIKYTKKPGSNLFEDDHEFESKGWNFIAAQIYQLPRSPQYLRVIGARRDEAEEKAE
jgi:hypothetical protein